MTFSSNIIADLLSAFIVFVIALFLKEPIIAFAIRLMGGWIPQKKRSIKGIWKSKYYYVDRNIPNEIEHLHEVEIKQFGKYIIGKRIRGNDSHFYKMSGKLYNDKYVTGIWETIGSKSVHHGTFQLLLNPKGDTLSGKLLGIGSGDIVHNGEWTMTLKKIGQKD